MPLGLTGITPFASTTLRSTEQESEWTSEASQQEAVSGRGVPGPQPAPRATLGENRIDCHLT